MPLPTRVQTETSVMLLRKGAGVLAQAVTTTRVRWGTREVATTTALGQWHRCTQGHSHIRSRHAIAVTRKLPESILRSPAAAGCDWTHRYWAEEGVPVPRPILLSYLSRETVGAYVWSGKYWCCVLIELVGLYCLLTERIDGKLLDP